MPYLVVRPDGSTQNTHANYDPAEAEAKLGDRMRVIYESRTGQQVLNWPLPPLNKPEEAREQYGSSTEPYL